MAKWTSLNQEAPSNIFRVRQHMNVVKTERLQLMYDNISSYGEDGDSGLC